MAYLASHYVRLKPVVMWLGFSMTLGGAVRFSPGWYFPILYLIRSSGTWPAWADVFLAALLMLGVAWILRVLHLLWAIARRYTLSQALCWHYLRNKAQPEAPPVVLLGTASGIASLITLLAAVILLVFLALQRFLGILADPCHSCRVGQLRATPNDWSEESGFATPILRLLAAVLPSVATSLNVILTIHKMRASGLTWFRLPLFIWAHYAFSISFIVETFASVFPLVLAIRGSFVSRVDDTTLLTQPLFWLSFHSAIFVTILPAMGVISEVIVGWGQCLPAEGETTFANMLCLLGDVLVAVLMMVQLFVWVITMRKGVIEPRAPMLCALGCSVLLAMGGMKGLFLAALATSVHLKSTFFALAHLHYLGRGDTFRFSGRSALLVGKNHRQDVS